VENHTAKYRQDKSNPRNYGGYSAMLVPVTDSYKIDEQQKGDMDIDINIGDSG
jgi:hypothetical protein